MKRRQWLYQFKQVTPHDGGAGSGKLPDRNRKGSSREPPTDCGAASIMPRRGAETAFGGIVGGALPCCGLAAGRLWITELSSRDFGPIVSSLVVNVFIPIRVAQAATTAIFEIQRHGDCARNGLLTPTASDCFARASSWRDLVHLFSIVPLIAVEPDGIFYPAA